MSNADQATTRARAQQQEQRQQQREQQQIWERERSELLQQMQELTARLGALEESTRGAAGQTSAGPTSTGQPSDALTSAVQSDSNIRLDTKTLIKSIQEFHGVAGKKPSAKAWTSLIQATFKGCTEQQTLAYIPTKLKGNAYHWYELQVRKAKGQPWNSINAFCADLIGYFSWEEPLDEALDSWDKIVQGKHETVIQ